MKIMKYKEAFKCAKISPNIKSFLISVFFLCSRLQENKKKKKKDERVPLRYLWQ